MSETKWTPGPWLRDGRTVYALEHAGWRKSVEQFKNRFYASVQQTPTTPEEEIEANARLIAAAPELYEALAEFMDIWNSSDSRSASKQAQARRAAMWTKANAAIAKSRGEA